ncbi:MAG: hypothetical protein KDC05_14015, partial [Bacteroidales bacterium]|nr:hypothetical protein [Bacteroidales bacterium]
MKQTVTLFAIAMMFCISILPLKAQVGINNDNSNPDPSAMLDVKSNSGGILIPRMSAAERDAITGPATGLLVFVTDDAGFYFFNGSAWEQVNTADSGWTFSGDDIVNTNTGLVLIT